MSEDPKIKFFTDNKSVVVGGDLNSLSGVVRRGRTPVILHPSIKTFFNFDIFNPEQQSFPASITDVTAIGFSSNVLAGWAMQETGGTTLADFSGNARTLTVTGDASRCLLGQRAVGLFDGSSFRAQRCVEFTSLAGTLKMALASTTALDFNWTTPYSVLVSFRAHTGNAGVGFISKGNWSGGGTTAFWGAYLGATNGDVIVTLADGASNIVTMTLPGIHRDGGWHWLYLKFDPVTDTVSAYSDVVPAGVSASTAAITTVSNALPFTIGQWDGLSTASNFQMRSLIIFSDVSTTVQSIQNWWRHGRTPSWFTYTRASSFHSIVGDDTTEGDILGGWASGQMAYEYNSLISTNTLMLGMSSYAAATNLVPYTDVNDTTNWATSGGTRAVYDADGVRGFREASKHTKTGATNMVLAAVANGAAVTATTEYTASIWCRWDGVGTAPELRVYRADGTTLIGTVSATENTGKRRRLSYTFTAPATESVRMAWSGAAAASTSGGAWFECPMLNIGNVAMPWISTKAATASTVEIVSYATIAGLTGDHGTIKVWAALNVQNHNVARFLCSATSAASDAGARRVGFGSTEFFQGVVFSAAAGVEGNPTFASASVDVATVETVATLWWDRSESYGWSARVQRNGVESVDAANLTAGIAIELVYIGRGGAGSSVNGAVSKVCVWRDVEMSA